MAEEDEVELISLDYEKLPKYRLRADCNVEYRGYPHNDFKLAKPMVEEVENLNDEHIQNVLEYFILCGLRVTKMTDTYEDIHAMRNLIQEQTSHLELAAKIGLELLETKRQNEERIGNLEAQIHTQEETILQVHHQLHLKDKLLKVFHTELENEEFDAAENSNNNSSAISDLNNSPGFSLESVNVKKLESQLEKLEEENSKLRSKYDSICSNQEALENKEHQLTDDCVKHLVNATTKVEELSFELTKNKNEYLNQHTEISKLLTGKINMENHIHQLVTENNNLVTQVRDYQIRQYTMTKELTELRDRYDECINYLNDSQDKVRAYKLELAEKEELRYANIYNSTAPSSVCGNSLASEIMEWKERENESKEQNKAMRMMEQVRSVKTNASKVAGTCYQDDETTVCSSGFGDFDEMTWNEESGGHIAAGGLEASPLCMSSPYPGNARLRHSIQQDCEKRRKLRSASKSESEGIAAASRKSQLGLEESSHILPDSRQIFEDMNTSMISSTYSDQTNVSGVNFRIPDKLQLVKPMQGSQTLLAWQNLATPNLTKALFENQPNTVCFRGQEMPLSSSSSSSNDGSPNSIANVATSDEDEDEKTLSSQHAFVGHSVTNPPQQSLVNSSLIKSQSSSIHSDFFNDDNSPNASLSNLLLAEQTSSYHAARPYSLTKRLLKENAGILKNPGSPAQSSSFHSDSGSLKTPVNDHKNVNDNSSVTGKPILPGSTSNVLVSSSSSSWVQQFMCGVLGVPPMASVSGGGAANSIVTSSSHIINSITNLPPLAKMRQRNSSVSSSSGASESRTSKSPDPSNLSARNKPIQSQKTNQSPILRHKTNSNLKAKPPMKSAGLNLLGNSNSSVVNAHSSTPINQSPDNPNNPPLISIVHRVGNLGVSRDAPHALINPPPFHQRYNSDVSDNESVQSNFSQID